MARPYNSRKYIYTDDFGTDTLKAQREYLDSNREPLVEITAKFQERLVDIPEKVETNFNGELQRHLLAYVNVEEEGVIAELKQFIPFNIGDDIKVQIGQILAKSNVLCGDYKGENSGNQRRLNQ